MIRYKYPRTFHLPWSPGASSDDKTHSDANALFSGHEIVVTEKMDGENTTIYSDGYVHARSIDSAHHPSRDWVKTNVAPMMIGHLPEGWRICGENLYAKHSIGYTTLPSYFLVFSIWDERNMCLSWEDTMEWCNLLGLYMVPVLFKGMWNHEVVKGCFKPHSRYGNENEGYVVRISAAYHFDAFTMSTAKYVRANHVQTEEHWMYATVQPNGIKA